MNNYNNEKMRRQDRALDEKTASEILSKGDYGVLSMVERIEIEEDAKICGYGIPLNYAWDGAQYIYFHSALHGRKLECIDAESNVSFCVVGSSKVVSSEFTTNFQSVITRGVITRNLEVEERLKALNLILDKYSPEHKKEGLKCIEDYFKTTEILRVEISSISGKSNGKF
ncbi:MAG: pyridoxamine 5'-phosphate oxidase family protein [Rikenellaceae bacterium]